MICDVYYLDIVKKHYFLDSQESCVVDGDEASVQSSGMVMSNCPLAVGTRRASLNYWLDVGPMKTGELWIPEAELGASHHKVIPVCTVARHFILDSTQCGAVFVWLHGNSSLLPHPVSTVSNMQQNFESQ